MTSTSHRRPARHSHSTDAVLLAPSIAYVALLLVVGVPIAAVAVAFGAGILSGSKLSHR